MPPTPAPRGLEFVGEEGDEMVHRSPLVVNDRRQLGSIDVGRIESRKAVEQATGHEEDSLVGMRASVIGASQVPGQPP